MTRSIFAIALFSATASITFSVNAADMIRDYERQPARSQHRYVVQQKAYYTRCDELVVEYRRPYVPHTDIVRLCDGYQPHVVARY